MPRTYFRETVFEWKADKTAALRVSDDGRHVVFTDLAGHAIHGMSYEHPECAARRVTLDIIVRPLPGCDTDLCIRQPGAGNLLFIDRDLTLRRGPNCEAATAVPLEDEFCQIKAVFVSRKSTLSIATCRGSPIYPGSGRGQYEFREIFVLAETCEDWFERVPISEKLTVVDVGAAFGLQACWLERLDQIIPILFEPNPAEAALLGVQIGRIPGGAVIQAALADEPGTKTLHVAHYAGCTSLLEPDTAFLGAYKIGKLFETVAAVEVECVRYDALAAAGTASAPDVIKLDVQGYEYEVLQGFGDLLAGCLGVELEAHLYPLYHGQKLLGDLAALLQGYGLMLQQLAKVEHFDGDLVEVNAWFTPGPARRAGLSAMEAKKLELIRQAWNLA